MCLRTAVPVVEVELAAFLSDGLVVASICACAHSPAIEQDLSGIPLMHYQPVVMWVKPWSTPVEQQLSELVVATSAVYDGLTQDGGGMNCPRDCAHNTVHCELL